MQLFNSFDPAPFHEKELDSAAEHYIVDTVKDFPKKTAFKIIIYLPPGYRRYRKGTEDPAGNPQPFRVQGAGAGPEIPQRFRHGRFTLLIGLSFLAIALFARQAVSHINNLLYAQIFADALLIIGWAAMWEPITVLLYELWPIIQQKHTYEKISTMEIEILPLSVMISGQAVDFFQES